MFRDTSAQDRPLQLQRGWRRHWRVMAIAAAALVMAALLLPGAIRLLSAQNSVSASRLEIASVERGTFVRDIAADGKVVAAVSPTLYAAAAGTVTLKVHAGDPVKNGTVLATIESPELSARLSQEQATLLSQQLDYQRAQLEADKQTLQAQDALQQAEVDQKTAQREVERSHKAYDLGAYSELQLLRAQDALEKAGFALQQAQKNAAMQPQQSRFDVDSRKAQLERQQFLVTDLQRQVAGLTLLSPVDGQVGQVQTADRASVAKDAALLSVIDLRRLELEMQVPEGFARDLAVGMPAQISGNGHQWDGELSSVSPEVVNSEVVARVRFKGDPPEGLRQNQRLSVRVLIDHKDDVLTVARGSWYDQSGGNLAYVVDGGIAERRTVRSGAASIDKVEILEGLQAGERIVVSGADAFNDQPRVVISR